MARPVIGLWVFQRKGALGLPEETPYGRAALALRDEAEVLFGERVDGEALVGWLARPGGWEPATRRVDAVWDRFAFRGRQATWDRLREAHVGRIRGNPDGLVAQCNDKLATQHAWERCGLPVPPVASDPTRFAASLAAWGAAFLKPRHGAHGDGVRAVHPGDDLPATVTLSHQVDPLLLQRAVPPPPGWAGVSLRVCVQRHGEHWVPGPVVARCHRTEVVVAVGRGAQALPGEEVLGAPLAARARELAVAGVEALDDAAHPWALEVGIDLLPDDQGRLWLLEANGRPGGRARALALQWPERFGEAHRAALEQPLRQLLTRL